MGEGRVGNTRRSCNLTRVHWNLFRKYFGESRSNKNRPPLPRSVLENIDPVFASEADLTQFRHDISFVDDLTLLHSDASPNGLLEQIHQSSTTMFEAACQYGFTPNTRKTNVLLSLRGKGSRVLLRDYPGQCVTHISSEQWGFAFEVVRHQKKLGSQVTDSGSLSVEV